ncbi:MAG: hemolysin family protein [Fibromonadales bacterium]|nr:hemolysin family protein [Fibromonadales bacterium]
MILLHISTLLLLMLASGIFSLIEMSFVSSRQSLLEQMKRDGKWGAARAMAIFDDMNILFPTMQTGTTLIGILAGAYGGAKLSIPFENFLAGLPVLNKYASIVALPAVIVIVTYFTLIIGELVPKRLALQFSEKLACFFAPFTYWLSIILKPIVWLLDFSGDVILRPFNLHESIKRPVTAEELQQMAKQGHQEGGIEKDELTMVKRVFNLSDRNIASVMTPRLLVEWLKLDMSKDELRGIIMLSEFSQFPVAEESLENPIGTVNAHDLLCQLAAGGQFNIQAMIKPPLFLPESVNAMDALRKMQKFKDPMALVIDQYGVCSGIVTLEDITSVLVAESELPSLSEDSLNMQNNAWVTDGLTDIHSIMEKFSLSDLPGEEPDSYHTLGGMAMTVLNKIPQAGDVFVWENLRFEVLSMNGQRVNKIKISRTDAPV